MYEIHQCSFHRRSLFVEHIDTLSKVLGKWDNILESFDEKSIKFIDTFLVAMEKNGLTDTYSNYQK